MQKALTWVTCALTLMLAGSAAAEPAAAPQESRFESAVECVSVTTDEDADGMHYELTNGCDVPLNCGISWSLECGEPGSAPAKPGQTTFAMEIGGERSVVASADACGDQGWRITGVEWSCSE